MKLRPLSLAGSLSRCHRHESLAVLLGCLGCIKAFLAGLVNVGVEAGKFSAVNIASADAQVLGVAIIAAAAGA